MDQDASNEEGSERLHPISQDTCAEQPLGEDATTDNPIITPEAEMDMDLPPFRRTEEMDGAPNKKIRMEIPDSEEVSEVSSPVKNDRDEEQRRDEAVELENLQMDQEAPGQKFEQDGTPKAERKMAREEISDSEEACESSSPIKVGVGHGASRDEVAPTTGGPEASGEGTEQEIENEGTTMMDFSAPEISEGRLDGSRPDIGEENELDRTRMSGNDTMELVDTMKEMEYTTKQGESPTSITENECTGHQTASLDNEHAPSADTSPTPAQTKETNSDASHADVNRGAILHETPQDKVNAGSMETFAQMPLSSPATPAKGIAAAAQGVLNEMVPTISDVNDRRETPKILKNFTAIPDSDDEEGDEPDAQVLGLSQPPALDTQLPAFPHQAFRNEGTPKAATFQSASNVPIEEQGQRGGDTTTTASLAALKGANSPTVTIASSDITSSISMAAVEPPSKKHAATQPLASMEQSIQGTEVKQAIELPSSLTDVQARAMPRTTSITQESSQATDTPSSPLQLMRRESSAAKKRELPPASFIVPEALQSKDVLMAELKAMKIASIQNRISALEAEIATKRAKLDEVVKGLKQPAAETVKNHIKLLHDYNDIRDVGQGLIGMIADNRGVRVGELYAEFGVGLQD